MPSASPSDDALVSVVYSSLAKVPFGDGDLALLLASSRAGNARHDVTGMLLHRDGRLLQVLEGPRAAVRRLMARIGEDPRHDVEWTLPEEAVDARRFSYWAMGFRSAEQGVPTWYGSPEATDGPAGALPPTRAIELLVRFRTG